MESEVSDFSIIFSRVKIKVAHPEHPALRPLYLELRILLERNYYAWRVNLNRNFVVFQLSF